MSKTRLLFRLLLILIEAGLCMFWTYGFCCGYTEHDAYKMGFNGFMIMLVLIRDRKRDNIKEIINEYN
jgi:hypothetical protein